MFPKTLAKTTFGFLRPMCQESWNGKSPFGGLSLDFGYDAIETTGGEVVLVGETTSQDFPEITSKGGIDMVVISLN